VEEGHLVAGRAVALSQARRLVRGWLGGDDWRRQREIDLVFLEAAVAGAVVQAAGWWGGLGRHRGGGAGCGCWRRQVRTCGCCLGCV
jgi:hypothetical protein